MDLEERKYELPDEVWQIVFGFSTDFAFLNFLGVSTQYARCALQAFADRNRQKPFVIEVSGHVIANTTARCYQKYIDAFGPLITNVKIVGSAHRIYHTPTGCSV